MIFHFVAKVCSNKLDLYPNMCIFKQVQCQMNLEHIPEFNTTTPCEENGSGEFDHLNFVIVTLDKSVMLSL